MSLRAYGACVDVEAVELVVRTGADRERLGLQHGLILTEHAGHALTQGVGARLAVEVVVAREGPEVETGFLCRRRNRVEDITVDTLGAVSAFRTCAGGRHADINRDRARRFEVDDLPTVDLARLSVLCPPERAGDRCFPSNARYRQSGLNGLLRTVPRQPHDCRWRIHARRFRA